MALKSMPNSYKIVLWVVQHLNDIIKQQYHGTLINILVLNICTIFTRHAIYKKKKKLISSLKNRFLAKHRP